MKNEETTVQVLSDKASKYLSSLSKQGLSWNNGVMLRSKRAVRLEYAGNKRVSAIITKRKKTQYKTRKSVSLNGIKKRIPWNKGLKMGPLSVAHKKKLSRALKGHKTSLETRRKIGVANAIALKGKFFVSKETLARAVAEKKRKYASGELVHWTKKDPERAKVVHAKIGAKRKGKPTWNAGLTKETDQRVARAAMILKDSPRAHAQRVARGIKGLRAAARRPNKFEAVALEYLNSIYGGKFMYTGDGSFILNNRSADAVSEELKTIALFNGVYWHLQKKGYEITEENKRIVEAFEAKPFLDGGYNVIFIWENEIEKIIVKELV